MTPKRRLSLLATLTLLAGCTSSDERYDDGYSDGHAAGYNTECKFGSTLIEGDFDNSNYAAGYEAGQRAGIRDCRRRNGS
ncbi:MAG: hypothetical protein ACYCZU_05265 [Devosia sp.]